MIRCPSCGVDNQPASSYCEDCGAQLTAPEALKTGQPRLEPLPAGATVGERLTIVSVLEEGPIRRYRAMVGDQSVLLLEALRSESTSQLQNQRELLGSIQIDGFFAPTEFLINEDFDYAYGPTPGHIRLNEKVEQSGPMPAAEVDALAQKLLAVTGQLHARGLILRALQPSRIWLKDNGEAVIDGWERAARIDTLGSDEEFCSVTAGFSAPEMYGLGKQDARVDLFSLGAVVYFCLVGQRAQLEARESFFTVTRPEVKDGEALVSVMMKALLKNPEERFGDAEAMRSALAEGLLVPGPAPVPIPAAPPVAAAATVPVAGRAPQPTRRAEPPPSSDAPWVAMRSHVGMVRKINQDACLDLRFQFFEKSVPGYGHLIAVVDGMGGEAEGDKAASIAMRTLAQEVVCANLPLRNGCQTTPLLQDEGDGMCRDLLRRALVAANANILSYASMDDARRGMGCTVTVCLLHEKKAYFGHVGDTRGFHYRQPGLFQVTTDHSLVGRLVAMGTMSVEEARNSPQRSIIYRALGTSADIEVDVYERDLLPGDRIVICCDGVWEYYEASELEGIVRQADTPQSLCDRLVEICLQRGADDNATVAAVWL